MMARVVAARREAMKDFIVCSFVESGFFNKMLLIIIVADRDPFIAPL